MITMLQAQAGRHGRGRDIAGGRRCRTRRGRRDGDGGNRDGAAGGHPRRVRSKRQRPEPVERVAAPTHRCEAESVEPPVQPPVSNADPAPEILATDRQETVEDDNVVQQSIAAEPLMPEKTAAPETVQPSSPDRVEPVAAAEVRNRSGRAAASPLPKDDTRNHRCGAGRRHRACHGSSLSKARFPRFSKISLSHPCPRRGRKFGSDRAENRRHENRPRAPRR